MMIRPASRALIAAVVSATTVVAFAGCTSARKLSNPQAADSEAVPKKEYQWHDMSTGKSFFRPIDPTPKD
jgi:hypothetical protein